MIDINNCTFTGRLTADATQKKVGAKATTVTEFSIANNTGFGDNAKTLFISVSVWGKQGETLKPYLQKGKAVGVTGSLELQQWISQQNGQEQKKLALNASSVILLSGGAKTEIPETQEIVEVEVVDDPRADITF